MTLSIYVHFSEKVERTFVQWIIRIRFEEEIL